MTFLTLEELSTQENVDPRTIQNWSSQKKINSVSPAHPLPKLFWKNNNSNTFAKSIAFMNLKGGAGKTTLTVNFSVYLARLGFKVLLIDTDHQNQCDAFFPSIDYKYSIDTILSSEIKPEDGIYTIEGETYKLDVIYSSFSLALFARHYSKIDGFLEMIEQIKNNYDFIIVDTSPNFDIINHNVAVSANNIIIPMIPTELHYKGLLHQLKALEQIARIPLDRVKGILPNLVNSNKVQHPTYIELVKEEFPNGVFEHVIPEDPYLEKLSTFRTNIFDYRENSKGGRAFKKATWELLRRVD
ncbi:MAG: ParA family protein [Spirochaetota bacterium]|nr:ParA family protein [Spirochaetota bacterium]